MMPRYWIDVFSDTWKSPDGSVYEITTAVVWETDTGKVVWKDHSPPWRDESEVRKAAADEVRRLLTQQG